MPHLLPLGATNTYMFPTNNGVPTCESSKWPKNITLLIVIQSLIEIFTEPGSMISETWS